MFQIDFQLPKLAVGFREGETISFPSKELPPLCQGTSPRHLFKHGQYGKRHRVPCAARSTLVRGGTEAESHVGLTAGDAVGKVGAGRGAVLITTPGTQQASLFEG